jgi:hypothetical protein
MGLASRECRGSFGAVSGQYPDLSGTARSSSRVLAQGIITLPGIGCGRLGGFVLVV